VDRERTELEDDRVNLGEGQGSERQEKVVAQVWIPGRLRSFPYDRAIGSGQGAGLSIRLAFAGTGHYFRPVFSSEAFAMTTGPNRILDEFAKLMTDAAGAAQGVRREVETAFRSQAERILNSMDVVQREEFEVVRDMVLKLRADNEKLANRVSELEAQLGAAASGTAETAKSGSRTKKSS